MEFEKLPGTKAQQTRFLRSQQDLKAKFEAQAAAKASGDGEGMGKTTWLVIGSEVWPKFCCIVYVCVWVRSCMRAHACVCACICVYGVCMCLCVWCIHACV